MEEYDVGIIGAGPGGVAAAIEASSLRAKVLLVEKDRLGGVCLNKGCIPTKAYLKSALVYDELKRSEEFGLSCKELSYDLSHIKRRANEIVERLRIQLESGIKSNKITVINAEASFLDASHISVNNEKLKARSFIIATGSSPKSLEGFVGDRKRIFCSEDILGLDRMPKDITIIGAGAIGCEFASFFAAFGVEVALLEAMERILPTQDSEISKRLEAIFRKRGIKVTVGISSIEPVSIKSEMVLICVGRSPNINGLDLEKLGIYVKDGRIQVNEYLQTNIPGIFAAGDCTGRYNLAHVASMEGRIAAANALGKKIKMDYGIVPVCIYSLPEVASVGMSAEEAESKGYKVKTGRIHLAGLGRAQAQSETEGFIKLVADGEDDTILGVQILGYYASELIGAVNIAIKGKLKTKDLAETVQAHPTLSEGIQKAALNLSRRAK